MLRLTLLLIALFSAIYCKAENNGGQILTLTSEDTQRYALIFAPEQNSTPRPLVFVFHGRGGSMHGISRQMDIHNHWKDAVVVYPQGMWCEGGYRDGFGWVVPDGADEGRDIRFFDTLLKHIKQHYNINDNNIYATGHSNGGGFTHALWALRGDVFKGFAVSAAGSVRLKENAKKRKPKPIFIIGGSEDTVVRIEVIQREIETAKRINGCSTRRKFSKSTTIYKGRNRNDVAVAIHPLGHKFQREFTEEIVNFFKYLQ